MKVREGNVSVHLYPTPTRVNGTTYRAYTVTWKDEAGRQRKKFTNKAAARTFANTKAELLDAGYKFHLTPEQMASYNRAHDTVLPTGRTLEQTATDAAEAHKLAPGIRILTLAEFWARHHNLKAGTPAQVLAELLAAKSQDNVSPQYLQELKIRIGKFAKVFNVPLTDLRSDQIEEWLRSLDIGTRSRTNYRRVLNTLFRFAISARYLPRGWDELPHTTRTMAANAPVDIYTPAELRRLLAAAAYAPGFKFSLLPFVALAAFAGIRSKEIHRLDWKQVGAKYIDVTAKRTRTASRRLVPVLPALKLWLDRCRGTGPVCPYFCLEKANRHLARVAGLRWKHNGLRHSFISYRVAQTRNVHQVALECGNSPSMIFQHYRERVTPQQAREWFGIRPKSVPKKFPKAAPPS